MDIAYKFNQNFLKFLTQLSALVNNDSPYYEFLQHGLTSWATIFKNDINTSVAAQLVFDAIGSDYTLLGSKDGTLFDKNPQLFHNLFNIDISDDVKFTTCNDYLQKLNNSPGDIQNLWDALQDLYRTSIILHIYNELPSLRQLIQILLKNKTHLAKQGNMSDMLKNIKNKHQMRYLINQMMECDDETMQKLMNLIKKILGTFGDASETDQSGLTTALQSLNFDDDPEKLLDNILNKVNKNPKIKAQFDSATKNLGIGNLSMLIDQWKSGQTLNLPKNLTI